ncbi:EF-P 5-aminopentanol modification-associated protein YfmF [Vermiculatibacterium agrestimuris]|uniref:EF-P 5-aminopentanol modification-associated protein YfmF n=1 Tax=Vermiculatibacterium agrestimuris TaxID=2941519 RepID=UPI00203E857E|nr:insulinase family protein [Vermiculatibacterium agrestimuris]
MATVKRTQLMPGVFLTSVNTKKFKSSLLSMTLLTPLKKETAAVNALIPYLLRRGSEAHPDLQSLSAALDQLYGGAIDPMVRKKGEIQCVGFLGGFLDDAYTLDGGGVLDQAAELMGELLLRPYTHEGAFCPDYTRQEKANLVDRIRAEINEKRQYAVNRVVEEMCREEAYGVGRLGREADVESITPQSAWARYQELLAHSRLELYYCGSAEHDAVCVILQRALTGLPREGGYEVPETVILPFAQETRRVEEAMDVAQGKLTMGFRTGGITAGSPDYPALVLCNALFGGTTTSKLFLNVREKLSLCYYASSSLLRYKGLMIVSSGVEFCNVKRAEDEIEAQLEACRRGEFESWEVEGARRYTVSSLLTMLDSQGRQEDWWLSQAVAGLTQSPQELAQAVDKVSVEAAVAAAKALNLDTVYFLKGMEG